MVKDINKTLGIEIQSLESEVLDIKTDFIDTGSDALNAILSSSVDGGVPIGKITGFYGPSGCGKSFIIGTVAANAQTKGFIPIIIDTEGTWDQRAETFGLNTKECILVQDDVIEDIRNNVSNIIDKYETELKSGVLKFIILLDSIGGLRCLKEVKDVSTNNNATDMGTRARVLRTLFKALTVKCAKFNIPFLWTNHCYDDPSAFCPSAIQKMPGGKAPWYFSSIIVMMRRKEEKDESDVKMIRNKGAILPIECVKQRYLRPNLKVEMRIDYSSGLVRHHGLFDIGREFGLIVGNRSYTLKDGTKLGYKKDILTDSKLWTDIIIPQLDPIMRSEFTFGSKTQTEIKSIDESEPEPESD